MYVFFMSFKGTKCPMCGTSGTVFKKDMFQCPNCASIFTEFALLSRPQLNDEILNH